MSPEDHSNFFESDLPKHIINSPEFFQTIKSLLYEHYLFDDIVLNEIRPATWDEIIEFNEIPED